MIAKMCGIFNWKIFVLTYLFMLILFTGNVMLVVFVWPHYDTTSLASLAIQSFVKAGLVEEALKLICWLPWIPLERKEGWHVLMVAALAGLLFAVNENCHMLAVLSFTPGIADGDILVTAFGDSIFLTIAYIRFFWGPLIHVSLTVIGYCVFRALRKHKALSISYLLVLVIPATLHGAYDLVTYVANHMEVEWCTHLGPAVAFTIILISLGMVVQASE